jgi:ABC-2 type transport system ATP-binding protein
MNAEPVIEVAGLTRRFGAKTALESVSVMVPRGGVYGLVGANGAGKTTLIKHILGLLRAEQGSVRVLGMDPVADPVGVLSRIGYLSEDHDLPGWMRVDELIRYSRAFYPAWDDAYAEELRRAFSLDLQAKVGSLSRGQRARAGLLVALAYRPELLVLDEPSSGLDPIVRRDILGAILRTIASEGRTVFFSSHLLEEVEQVADHVTMISHGTIALTAPLRQIRETHRRLRVRFDTTRHEPPQIPGALRWDRNGTDNEWMLVAAGALDEVRASLASCGASVLDERSASLDEVFVAHVGSSAASPSCD